MRRQEKIEDEALEWLIRREGPDWTENEDAKLNAWLEEAMAHKAAFWRAEHGWQNADRIRSIGFDNGRSTEAFAPKRHGWKRVAVAASLLAALAIGGLTLSRPLSTDHIAEVQQSQFDTPVGGRKIVDLVDGSRLELNTSTRLRAAVNDRSREVWLDSGEAFFEVAHREGNRFVVYAGRQQVVVLGTKFSVRRDGERVTVNVLEGLVKVQDSEGTNTHVAIIGAGDTAIARGASTLISSTSEERVENALAWRDGMLSFDRAPLSTVVSEFNRYNRIQLAVTDQSVAQITIGGSFRASSVESFVRLLQDAYGLKIEQDDGVVKISSQ